MRFLTRRYTSSPISKLHVCLRRVERRRREAKKGWKRREEEKEMEQKGIERNEEEERGKDGENKWVYILRSGEQMNGKKRGRERRE